MVARELHAGSPDYLGVLWRRGAFRVAVASGGTRYLVQRERSNGWWTQATWALDRSSLLERLPAEVPASALEGVPELPGDVDRPWADLRAEGEAREARDAMAVDDHPGELVRDRNARLVRLADDDGRPVFAVQRRSGDVWRTLAVCTTADQLRAAVQPAGARPASAGGAGRRRGPRRVRSDRLRGAVDLLASRGEL